MSVVCAAPYDRRCRTPYAVRARTPAGRLRARFVTPKSGCVDLRLQISVGGAASTSAFVGRDAATAWGTFAVGAGTHAVSLRAEGRPGGCSTTGRLRRWAGTLELRLG